MLAQHLDSDTNSFNLVRLIAAFAVVTSHSFLLVTGLDTAEPLAVATPYTLGQHAVNAFFVISGLTLARSISIRPDLPGFVAARVLRIFPGLLVAGLLVAFAIGPVVTEWPIEDYLASPETWRYPFSTLVFFDDATPPHGLFLAVPLSGQINEPLWTIKYELVAYAGLVTAFLLGWISGFGRVLMLLAALVLAMAVTETGPEALREAFIIGSLERYGICFLIGVALYHARDRVPTGPLLLVPLALLVWLLDGTAVQKPAWYALTAGIVVVLGARRYGRLSAWTTRTDISYGTYLYAWPIQQTLLTLAPSMTVGLHLLASGALAAAAGLASWSIVEKPFLSLKARLRGRDRGPAGALRPPLKSAAG